MAYGGRKRIVLEEELMAYGRWPDLEIWGIVSRVPYLAGGQDAVKGET